jgi:hypothetical protein
MRKRIPPSYDEYARVMRANGARPLPYRQWYILTH